MAEISRAFNATLASPSQFCDKNSMTSSLILIALPRLWDKSMLGSSVARLRMEDEEQELTNRRGGGLVLLLGKWLEPEDASFFWVLTMVMIPVPPLLVLGDCRATVVVSLRSLNERRIDFGLRRRLSEDRGFFVVCYGFLAKNPFGGTRNRFAAGGGKSLRN
ncbi:hypothetical protein L2E82_17331 [Cichorium intybus]|uniref:Uncharacterized protein n=1 Tax=Cichorium intybus TaxID=13427 RepID=A0ACB9F804_CICIN|nr:hypothetical protein L2E82_17331 [Cichorium intybus]